MGKLAPRDGLYEDPVAPRIQGAFVGRSGKPDPSAITEATAPSCSDVQAPRTRRGLHISHRAPRGDGHLPQDRPDPRG